MTLPIIAIRLFGMDNQTGQGASMSVAIRYDPSRGE
jgi:hypothetical protein